MARAMVAAFAAQAHPHPPAWIVRIASDIPPERGLGSSAAAIVGGLAAANGWLGWGGRALSQRRLLELAAAIEGHADNVAAAVLGGVTLVWASSASARRVLRARLFP